ncbi:UNVERIFIED_CONTAM: hypothetical protein PYX00_003438 [Menopon gallinae]|uniref:Translation machinery-associated protein 16 n=1 Tax=Menopon gallinae TaxID=328185 RepID=A0AAW2I093_9NEOP
MKQNLVGEKFLWFKERIESADEVTPAKVLELMERYLGRFDEELEQIQLKHTVGQRKSRQHASREDVIRMTKKREMNEFNTCGLEMPNLLNPKQLSMLMEWEGELRFLQNFKIVRYSRSHLENLIKKSSNGEKTMDEESQNEADEKEEKTGKGHKLMYIP